MRCATDKRSEAAVGFASNLEQPLKLEYRVRGVPCFNLSTTSTLIAPAPSGGGPADSLDEATAKAKARTPLTAPANSVERQERRTEKIALSPPNVTPRCSQRHLNTVFSKGCSFRFVKAHVPILFVLTKRSVKVIDCRCVRGALGRRIVGRHAAQIATCDSFRGFLAY